MSPMELGYSRVSGLFNDCLALEPHIRKFSQVLPTDFELSHLKMTEGVGDPTAENPLRSQHNTTQVSTYDGVFIHSLLQLPLLQRYRHTNFSGTD